MTCGHWTCLLAMTIFLSDYSKMKIGEYLNGRTELNEVSSSMCD